MEDVLKISTNTAEKGLDKNERKGAWIRFMEKRRAVSQG